MPKSRFYWLPSLGAATLVCEVLLPIVNFANIQNPKNSRLVFLAEGIDYYDNIVLNLMQQHYRQVRQHFGRHIYLNVVYFVI